MIFGVLIAVIPTFARRRGLRVPGPSRLRLRRPRSGVAGQLTDSLAARADELLQRHLGGQGRRTTHRNGEDLPGWLRTGADRSTTARSG